MLMPKKTSEHKSTSREICRRLALATSALALSATLSSASVAESRLYNFKLNEQPLADALVAFSEVTGVVLSVRSELLDGRMAPILHERLPAAQALARLLRGTGIDVFERGDGSLMVHARSEEAADGYRRVSMKMDSSEAAYHVANLAVYQDDVEAVEVDDFFFEEIVVTAQKRGEQSLQEVPISMSVLGGENLDAGNFEGVNDALAQVAGVQLYDTFQGGGTKISMRGVTSNSSLFDGGGIVGYYLDDVPFGFVKTPVSPDANAYDMERVEVLRGPQGTLYGASALNGVVRVLTRDANLDEFEFKARTSFSSTKGGGENYRGDMAINLPLIPGKLAIRGVVGYNDLSGWIDQPNNNTENANTAELTSYRLKVNAQPTDNLSIEMSAWVSRDDRGAASAADDDGNNPTFQDEPISTDYEAYGLSLEYTLPGFTVTSATSYIDYDNVGALDVVSGFDLLTTGISAKVFAEELRLTSTLEGPWRWSLGAMYREAEDQQLSALPVIWNDLPEIGQDKSKSIAVFGEVARTFLDGQFELSVGLRYFDDDVSSNELSRFNAVLPSSSLISSDSHFDSLTPRVVLTWLPSDDLTAYASYSQGFRSGFEPLAFTQATTAIDVPAISEDLLTNYEIGVKGTLGSRFSYEAALYYIDWKDTQQRIFVDIGNGLQAAVPLNGETVDGFGIDLSLSAALTDSLTVGATISQNNLGFAADVESGGVIVYNAGDRVDESPETTIGLTADYLFTLGGGYEGRIAASANYHSKLSVTDGLTGDTVYGDGIMQSQLRMTISAPENWTAVLYVDNLTNEDGIVRPVAANDYYHSRLRPRTIGLQLEYKY